ncbi:ISAs1 family transposase [Candidatus Accumulibacter contiguus]|uniref:ISAs1 family transposase n=2 Tax=Candidatus Accumulibacter contiguus TaxID=2954381 RepID=UPI00145EEAE8|nr:ISAs1 family transposase [Candidatus Accumulibacter contiguus]
MVERSEEERYQEQMARHHYLGALAKIGETVWYVATWREQWVAQLSISAAALKCGVRDRWIGWDFRSQYGRLKLIANNSRFLILPEWHWPNVGSRVLSLTERRVVADWQARFGHPLLLLETFVDPRQFHGGVYRAANWIELGLTQGYRRTREGYSAEAEAPKRVFVRPLCRTPQVQLTHPDRAHLQLTGAAKIMLNADQMRQLPQCFTRIPDPRRAQGRRHRLPVVLGIAAGATLCGMRGYKAISNWADALGQKARERFGCRREKGQYLVPSESVIRDCLVRIEPDAMDGALNTWNQAWGTQDEALALDGKTMKKAIDETGEQAHILSVVGHDSKTCYAQKKVGTLPVAGSDEQKRTNEIGMAIPLLKTCDLAGKDITADALLTQRALATYLVEQQAHYHFTGKGNQPTLERDIALLFEKRQKPDFVEITPPDHGRIETRSIWCSTALNAYIPFPHVAQVFLIEREIIEKKTGQYAREIALGITSRTPQEASPQRVLATNRGHWSVESVHYIID